MYFFQLNSDVFAHDKSKLIDNETVDNDSTKENSLNPRQILQLKRKRMKEERLKEKYIQKCKRFLKNYDEVEHCIKRVLSSNSVDELLSVCYVFGTSSISPKEVYRIQFPKGKDCKTV